MRYAVRIAAAVASARLALEMCSGAALAFPQLPEGTMPDTEVSTNFTFAVGEGSNRRLVFSLELAASPTNNVEVAIGCDEDEDGLLSLDETALTVGYDCGEWFVRSAANDSVTYFDVADSGVFRRTYEVRSLLPVAGRVVWRSCDVWPSAVCLDRNRHAKRCDNMV